MLVRVFVRQLQRVGACMQAQWLAMASALLLLLVLAFAAVCVGGLAVVSARVIGSRVCVYMCFAVMVLL